MLASAGMGTCADINSRIAAVACIHRERVHRYSCNFWIASGNCCNNIQRHLNSLRGCWNFLHFVHTSGWFLNFGENCVRDSGVLGMGCACGRVSSATSRTSLIDLTSVWGRTVEIMRNHCSQDSKICKYGLASSSVG